MNNEVNQLGESYDDLKIEHIKDIESKWHDLKKYLIAYRHNRTENLLEKIINKSEDCWKASDFAVLKAQTITENKISRIKFLYIILSVLALNTLIVIWVVYSYVRKNLEFKASHDSLTGLFNRHSYEKFIEAELERSIRYKHKFSLILFDVDFFKNINDTYGHKTGDIILKELSQTVKNSIRKIDEIFRIGGEEFAIIIPETGIDISSIIAEKVREDVENNSFYKDIKVTISLGVADSSSEKTISDI
ncbi:MAG: GGDEF domain-containing protein, partial [Desulfamplus sp.]|nr:GGDEF domain-containing protein [Desulfamplus sp.]